MIGTWALACTPAGTVSAQALDEQYSFFLGNDCKNLAFELNDMFSVPETLAGPNLAAFCSAGPPLAGDPAPGGGSSSTSATGGGAAAGAGRGRVSSEDAAVRRRQAEARGEESALRPATDLRIAELGRAGAFFSLDYQLHKQRPGKFEDGRRAYSFSATVGADYRIGATALAGLALSYTDLSGSFTSGGDYTTRGRSVWAFGSWFPHERLFIDFSAGMGGNDMGTSRLVGLSSVRELATRTVITFEPPLRFADGRTNSRERGAELAGGYDFFVAGVTLGPRAAIAARRTSVGGFVERGDTPMTLAFHGQTEKSLRSALGVQASKAVNLPTGALIAQLNLNWLHEFRDDQRFITARFAEDLRLDAPQLRFLNEAPDRDWYNVRASLIAVFSSRFSGFLSLESTAAHSYRDHHGASLGFRREF